MLSKFPVLVQRLVLKQRRRALWRRNHGKVMRGVFQNDKCFCLFRVRKYLVPCQHMFHHDLVKDTKFLTQERWRMFANLFEEGGMEVYAKHIQ